MKDIKNMLRLYAVTDRSWTGEKTLLEQIEESLKGGVTCLQLREKELEQGDFLQEAIQVKALCEKYKVPLIINDNVDVAVKCEADGVHLGLSDRKVDEVRQLVGRSMIIGATAKSIEQAHRAKEAGADYLGVGAVFGSATKKDAKKISIEELKEICACTDLPVVAIGGIDSTNLEKLTGTGIDGVAMVSAIYGAKEIEKTCRELRKMTEEVVKE